MGRACLAGVIAGVFLASAANAALPTPRRAFVPQELPTGAGTLAVINADTNAVETSIGGFNTPRTAAVTPDGLRVLVTDSAQGNVKVYDTETLALLATIPGIADAWGIDVNPAGTEAYVVGRTPAAAAVMTVISLVTNTVAATVPALGTQSAQRTVITSPTGNYIYVTNNNTDNVWAIRRSDLTKVAIAVGDGPCATALDAVGQRLFVVNQATVATVPSVSVIDVNEGSGTFNTVIATINLPTGIVPRSIALHPKGTFGFIGANSSTSVHVFDMATLTMKSPIPTVSANISGVAVDPDGTRVYAYHPGNDRISVISAYTRLFTQLVTNGTGFIDKPGNYSSNAFTPTASDSFVQGTVSPNIDLRLINCKNDTTGMHTTGQVVITGQNWSCDTLGVPSSKGDTMRITIWARANAAGPSTSTIEGANLDAIRVTNTSAPLPRPQGECNRSTGCLPPSESPATWETLHSMPMGTGTGFTVAPGEDITIGYWFKRN